MDKSHSIFNKDMQKQILVLSLLLVLSVSVLAQSNAFADVLSASMKNSGSRNLFALNNTIATRLLWVDNNGKLFVKNGADFTNSSATVTFSGLTSTGTIALGVNKITTTTYDLKEVTGAINAVPAIIVTPTSGNTVGQFIVSPAGTSVSSQFILARTGPTANLEGLMISSDQNAAGQFEISSVKTGTGTQRPLVFYSGVTATAAMDTSANFGVYATKKFCLDFASGACGNNYIYQSSANVIDTYAGGVLGLRVNSDSSFGSPNWKIQDFSSNPTGIITIKNLLVNGAMEADLVPSGTNTNSMLISFGGSDRLNAPQLIFSENFNANEADIVSKQIGTGVTNPMLFYIGATNVLTLNTASPYFQFKESATGAGSAALGANSPAVTNTAPYDWIKVKCKDGTGTCYIPEWK